MKIKEIDQKTADKIVENRKPIGLFYFNEKGMTIGINNSKGDAFVEEFSNQDHCLKWLKGK